ncbi:hypothetical protein BDN67DRAFT_428342 [Paxillus ammoniavirescens]|nr:hypothetical protein BDN67DRAFT_428342 [Paxillus ammoniavirescens]
MHVLVGLLIQRTSMTASIGTTSKTPCPSVPSFQSLSPEPNVYETLLSGLSLFFSFHPDQMCKERKKVRPILSSTVRRVCHRSRMTPYSMIEGVVHVKTKDQHLWYVRCLSQANLPLPLGEVIHI